MIYASDYLHPNSIVEALGGKERTLVLDRDLVLTSPFALNDMPGLTVVGPGQIIAAEELYWAVKIRNCPGLNLDGVAVSGGQGGIEIHGCDRATVQRCRVTGQRHEKKARGMEIEKSDHVLVERSTFENIGSGKLAYGLCFKDQSYMPVVRDNLFSDITPMRDADGLKIMQANFDTYGLIENNLFIRCAKRGIKLQTNRMRLHYNTILETQVWGISCQIGHGMRLKGNRIESERAGIMLWCDENGHLDAKCEGDEITGTMSGVQIYGKPGQKITGGARLIGVTVRGCDKPVYLRCDRIDSLETTLPVVMDTKSTVEEDG